MEDLLRELQATQQAQARAKLSERNVVELVFKLKALGILGDDLLHTINGKEFITTQRLKQEVLLALRQSGGRLALVELPALVGCDLVHCERQAAEVVLEGGGSVLEAQGELITTQYFDSIAAEINDLLQEAGQISLSDLAVQYALSTELVARMVSERVGSTIKGRLEAGLLYTSSYLRNVKASLRGALRGVAQPTTMTAVVKELGLEGAALGGTGGGSVVAGLVEELVREGAVCGTLRGGGVNWVPACYSTSQRNAVVAFYEQNGWVSYDTAQRMGIHNAASFLKQAFPEAIALETALVGPLLLAQLEGAVEEAVAPNAPPCWTDVGPLLPSILTPGDTTALLALVPQLADAQNAADAMPGKGGRGTDRAAWSEGAGGGALVLAGTCVVSGALVAHAAEEVCVAARRSAEKVLTERRAGGRGSGAASTSAPSAAPGNQAAGKASKAVADGEEDEEDEDWSMGGKKGGKGGKGKGGGKAGKRGGVGAKAKGGGAAGGGKAGPAAQGGGVTAAQIEQQLLELHPDLEGMGSGRGVVAALAALLHPLAAAAFEAALSAAFTTSAEEKRQAKEGLAKALDVAHQRLFLYAVGTEDFAPLHEEASEAEQQEAEQRATSKGSSRTSSKAAGPPQKSQQQQQQQQQGGGGEDVVYPALVRHALRTTGAEAADALCKWAHVEFDVGMSGGKAAAAGGQQQPEQGAALALLRGPPLTQAERSVVLRAIPQDVAPLLVKACEAMSTAPSIKVAVVALEEASEALGLRLKAVDKKVERAALAQVRSELMGALSAEHDPATALALVVPLLFMRATGKAVAVPGKALGAVLARCGSSSSSSGSGSRSGSSGGLTPAALSLVQRFHAQIVEHLVLLGSGGGAKAAELAEELTAQLQGIKEQAGVVAAADPQ